MKLYKYMSNNDFLSNFKLRFTPPSELNDPRECVPDIHIKDPRGYINDVMQRNFERGYLRLLIDNTSMSPKEAFRRAIDASKQVERDFHENNDVWVKRIFDSIMEVTNRNVAVLSLTETQDNEVMWAHYANSHKGYVVGFESDSDFFMPRKGDPRNCGELMPVQYSDASPKLFVEPGNLYIPKELYFTKTTKWSYEREWRIVRMQSSADDVKSGSIHLFKVPSETITSVTFGYKFPESTKASIESVIKYNAPHVKFYNANFNHKGEFLIS